jgi:hypothetical protein
MSHATEHHRIECYATRDRHDPEMTRCFVCGLVWDSGDPDPPRCRLRDADDDPVTDGRRRPSFGISSMKNDLSGMI